MLNLSSSDQKKAVLAMGAAATLGALYFGFKKKKTCVKNKCITGEEYLSQEEASKRKQIIQGDVSYEVSLNLQKGTNYSGVVTINFLVKHADDLILNFSGKQIKSLIVNGVTVSGESTNFKNIWKESYLHIPKTLLKVKNLNSIIISFKNVYNSDGTGLFSFTDVDGCQYLYTENEPYHCQKFIPCFDQPDIKGVMSLEVEGPEDWNIISNEGTLDVTLKGSRKKTLFSRTKPISTYLYCMCAGPWEKVQWSDTYKGIPMAIYSRKSLKEHLERHSENLKEVTNKCMKWYEEFFNFPYPFSKYDQIFVPEMNFGAMENPGSITFTDTALYQGEVKVERLCVRAMVVAHEMAHMWFGDLVTMEWWNDLWLNESFADFAAFTCLHSLEFTFEHVNFMELWFSDQQWGFEQDKKPTTHPIAAEVVNTLQAETIFDGITYAKGAATMKQLFFLMGKQAFSKAINQYFCKYAWGNATLHDFIDSLNLHFTPVNGYDLYKWKDEWISKAGINQILPEWSFSDSTLSLLVHQSAYINEFPTLRSHKINVGIIGDNDVIHRKEIFIENKEKTSFSLQLDEEIGNVKAVYLNIDEYSFVQTNLDEVSFEYFQENLGKLNDSFLRNMIWKSIYDMVEDGKLSSKKFLDTVITNIHLENSPATLSDLCNNTRVALVTYVPKKSRQEIASNLFSKLYSILSSSDLNQEVVKVLVTTLIASAKSQQNQEKMISFFNGELSDLQKYSLSIYDEWMLTKKIAASVEISLEEKNKLISKMEEKDKSDQGKKNLDEISVILANEEERKEIWNEIIDLKSEATLHSLISKMRGYNVEKHVNYEYISQYYGILPTIFKNKSFDFARNLFGSLDPHHSEDFIIILQFIEETLEKLEKSDLALIRKLKEQKDEIEKRMVAYDLFSRT